MIGWILDPHPPAMFFYHPVSPKICWEKFLEVKFLPGVMSYWPYMGSFFVGCAIKKTLQKKNDLGLLYIDVYRLSPCLSTRATFFRRCFFFFVSNIPLDFSLSTCCCPENFVRFSGEDETCFFLLLQGGKVTFFVARTK